LEKKVNALKKRKEILLLILLFLGLFLRSYRLTDLMIYLGDEGRDMLIVKDIIDLDNFPLIGPPTSVGQLFLGPIYYYMITPFVLFSGLSPVGPAVFVVLLGTATIYLIYLVGKSFFNQTTGLICAVLYAVSPLIIEFSRSSWNPNPMPFFTLLMILSLFWWKKKKKSKFLYLAAIFFSVMLQLHYLSVLLLPLLIFIVYHFGKKKTSKGEYFVTVLIMLLMISPLFVFDLKHNYHNSRGLWQIVSGRSEEGFSLIDLLSRSRDRIRQLYSLFFSFEDREWKTHLLALVSLLLPLYQYRKQRKKVDVIIYGWVIWGFLSLGFYRHSVYPHYLGYLFPIPALFVGNLISFLTKKRNFGKAIALFLFVFLIYNMTQLTWKNISRDPVINVAKVKKTVRLIEQESNDQPFNFSLLAENNYDSSYRYFFELWNIPARYETKVTEQLFVVCEDDKVCQPEGNSKWEIAMFDGHYNGEIKREGFWKVEDPIEVYKFVPK
jgi:4-amino-4-deoxy-L-arabinose transferase-like glycosyltransferase